MPTPGERKLLEALKKLQGLSIQQLARVLRNPRNVRVLNLMDRLGASGKLIKDLSNLALKRGADARSLKALQDAVKASGTLVLPPLDKRGRFPKGFTKQQQEELTKQAIDWLERRGYKVSKREEKEIEQRRRQQDPLAPDAQGMVTLPLPDNDVPKRWSMHHPIVTREMVRATASSNVHSYGYDWRSRRLYVRFLGGGRNGEPRRGKGPLYGYEQVPPRLFIAIMEAASKGTWVWDHLRIRGTISGHQFDYALRGIGPSLYVPRKATLTAEGEAFMPRSFLSFRTNRVHESQLPFELVRPLRPGFPDRGNNFPRGRGGQ